MLLYTGKPAPEQRAVLAREREARTALFQDTATYHFALARAANPKPNVVCTNIQYFKYH